MHRPPLLLAAALLQSVLLCLVSLGASPAAACSPPLPDPRYYTFAESLPADGATGFPLDGAVLLIARAWAAPRSASTFEAFDSVLTVTLQDTVTGETVPGALKDYWWGQPGGAAWAPQRPLSPNRRYALVATLTQTASRPEQAEGPTELRLSFTTGTQPSAPLELLGELEVRLEEREVPTYDCAPDSCGACEPDGEELRPHAWVRVPGLKGGAPGDYRVSLWVTDRKPLRFDLPLSNQGHALLWGVWGVTSEGAPTSTLFQMPQHDDAYPPCFSWQVEDAAGRTLDGPPVCLDERVDTSRGFLGCSVVGPGASGGLMALLLLGVTLRSRRRLGR
jgi:hypothetical protein